MVLRPLEGSTSSTQPQISVVIPVKNGATFIKDAIQSMVLQSLKPLEIIVIDDNSTDRTVQIVKTIRKTNPIIKIIKSNGKGISSALNLGIQMSCGQWIARMDADDISSPKRLEEQYEYAMLQRLDIVGCNCKLFGASNGELDYPENHDACKVKQVIASPIAHPSAFIKKRVFNQLLYRKDYDKVEDYDLWERAFRNGFRFGNVQKYLLSYRVHSAQVTKNDYDFRREKARIIRIRSLFLIMPHWSKEQVAETIDFLFYDGHPSKKTINFLLEFLHRIDESNAFIMQPYLRSAFFRRPGRFLDVLNFWIIHFGRTKKISVLITGLLLTVLCLLGEQFRIKFTRLRKKLLAN